MRRPLVSGLCALLLTTGALAQTQPDSLQALFDRMLQSPPGSWDQILDQRHPSLSNPQTLSEWHARVARMSGEGKDDDAARLAEAVDYAAYYSDPNKVYTGATQITLVIIDLASGKENLANDLTRKLANHAGVVPDRLFLWGKTLEQKKPEVSLLIYKQLLKVNPDPAWAEREHLELATTDAQMGRTTEASAEIREVLKIDPKNALALDWTSGFKGDNAPKTTSAAAGHFERAEQLFSQQKYPEAMAEYDKALSADPKLAKAWVYKGDCYNALGQADEAIKCYRQAIALDPHDRQGYRFLGDMLEKKFDQNGDRSALNEAITCYRKAVELSPDYNLAQEALRRATAKAQR